MANNDMMSGILKRFDFHHSFVTRAWAMVMFITLIIAILGAMSFSLSKVAKTDAQAINQAGAIRMATYRISHALSIDAQGTPINVQALNEDMLMRLSQLRNYQSIAGNQHGNIDQSLIKIENLWQNNLQPRLLAEDNVGFYESSLAYLTEVNNFVLDIQKRSEVRSQQQQYLHIGTLLLILAAMLIGMHELNKNALIPLKRLTETANSYKQGSLNLASSNVSVKGYQEINQLSDAMSAMLSTINTHQSQLKSEVRRTTAHLTQANQAIYALYNFAQKIVAGNLSSLQLQSLVKEFSALLPNSEMSLCLHEEDNQNNIILSLSDKEIPEFCTPEDCDECQLKAHSNTRIISIEASGRRWGELLVNNAKESQLKIDVVNLDDNQFLPQEDLLIALANLVALALVSKEKKKQEQELLLSEERNTLARELHDSIAQSLSYLKIQLSMLKTLMQQSQSSLDDETRALLSESHTKQAQLLAQMTEGLNAAYGQLRDLLTTFRLRIDGGDFNEILSATMDEFAKKGGFSTSFDNQILTVHLSASEQIDLLQIMREALSNILKHAKASHVSLALYQDSASQDVVMIIKDDGIGIEQSDKQKQGHYGLSTMGERAVNLGGMIDISNAVPHGTQVSVRFMPQFFLKQSKSPRPEPKLNSWSDDEINTLTQALDDELNHQVTH